MHFRRPSFLKPKSLALLRAAGFVCEAKTYRPLFDGKTLKGWHFQGAGSWKVMDGVIVGTLTKDGDHGHLVTDSSFTDFQLRFQWKLSPGGNSGLYFHGEKGGTGGMIGAQLEMDETFSGGLYSTATHPWGSIYQTKAEDAKKWYRPGDWNDVVLIVDKNTVANTQNGFTTMNVTSPNLGAKGQFGFQLHATLDMTLWLRNIEWSEVPGTTSLPASGDKERGGMYKDIVAANPAAAMVYNNGVEGYNSIPTMKKKTEIGLKQAGGMMFWQFAQDAAGSLSLLSAVNEGVVKYGPTGILSVRPVAVSKSAGNRMLWSGRGGMSLGISGDLGPESRFDPAGRRLHGMQLTAVPAGKTAL